MHRFGHKLGIKSKSQLTIKAQNLEATLPAIIFIRAVFHLLLREQDHQEGAGVRELYKMYEMYEIYERYEMYNMYKMYENATKCYENAMQILRKRNAAEVRRHTRTLQTLCTRTPCEASSSNARCRSPHPNA